MRFLRVDNTYRKVDMESLEQYFIAIPHASTIEKEYDHETRYKAEVCRERLKNRSVAGKFTLYRPALESFIVRARKFIFVYP